MNINLDNKTKQDGFSGFCPDALWNWMNTWKQDNGYGGFLLHCIHGIINFSYAKPVPSYTYRPLINGFSTLYKRTKNVYWEERLIEAEAFLMGMTGGNGLFRYSGFEYAPREPSVVHNAWATWALLDAYEVTKNQAALEKAAKCLKSMICYFWDGTKYSGTVNQSLSVAAALAKHARLTGDTILFTRYGLPVISWSLSLAGDKLTKEDELKNAIIRGMYGSEKYYVSPWYNAKKAECFLEIFLTSGHDTWLKRAKQCLTFTFESFLAGKGLIHSIQKLNGKWTRVENPLLILPMFYVLKVAERINQYEAITIDREIERWLLTFQLPSGYFQNTEGYGIRDFIGSLPWNAFAFDYLSSKYLFSPYTDKFTETTITRNIYTVHETKEILSLYLEDRKIIEIKKNTGEIIKTTLPPQLITGKIVSKPRSLISDTHLSVSQAEREVEFGIIDPDGNYYLPNVSGEKKLWHPYATLRTNTENNCIRLKEKLFTFNKIYHSPFMSVYLYLMRPLVKNSMFQNLCELKFRVLTRFLKTRSYNKNYD